jgi:lipooligosaccharide transport system ATP-binding protein
MRHAIRVDAAISLRGVVKRFGDRVAVDGLDLDVERGTCVGLLGPNGAGKTTTMRLLTAQAVADEGQLDVLGFELPRESKQVRAEIGVVPQLDNLDVELTARENLSVFAALYRVPRKTRRAAVEQALARAGLADRADMSLYALSGGMRRRLLVARGLVHRPRVALLDEPTVGLDPQIRRQLWALIDELREEGLTVLMTTHYIEEAERLADTVAVMAAGRVIARGPPAGIVATHAGDEVLEVYGRPAMLEDVERWAAGNGHVVRHTGVSLAIMHAERIDAIPEGMPHSMRRPSTLEDAFVILTGEDAGQGLHGPS